LTNVIDNSIAQLSANNADLNTEMKQLKRDMENLDNEKEELTRTIEANNRNLNTALGQLKDEKEELAQTIEVNDRNLNTALEQLKDEKEELSQTIETNNRHLNTEIQQLKDQRNELRQDMNNLLPVGSIIAWVTKPTKYTSELASLPDGWVRCNGDIIPRPSIWAGKLAPDLNGEKRFLRGNSDRYVLTLEEDQMQDHKHTLKDPGHAHPYVDKWPNGDQQYHSNDHWGSAAGSDKAWDRWDQPHNAMTTTRASGVKVENVSGGRSGSETRPRNMNVIYIMKVW